jgi:hypothetical protein
MTAAGVAANLGGVALMVVPGLGLTELLAPLRRLPWPRRLGYAFLLGVGALGAALFAASHLAGVPLRRPAIALAALVPAAFGAAAAVTRRWRRPGRRAAAAPEARVTAASSAASEPLVAASREHAAPAAAGGPPGRAARSLRAALAVAAVLVLAGPLLSALTVPLVDWDGRMTWASLAAYLRYEGTVDAEVLRDPHWLVLHPRYPPLMPLAQAAIQELFGADHDDQFFRALYVAFLGALLAIVFDGARRSAGRRAAALTTLCAALPPVLGYGYGGAISAYSDLPLAAFYGGSLVLLLAGPLRPATGLAAGCLLAAAVLTKNEGVLLAAVALLLAASRLWRRRSSRSTAGSRGLAWLGAAALPVLAASTLLAAWRGAIPNREDEDYFAALRIGELLHGAVSRLPLIARGALQSTFAPWTWLGFWAVFVVVVAAGRRALARPLVWRLALAGLAPLAIGCGAYAISTRPLPLVAETWPRFLVQALVPLGLVFACALALLLDRLANDRRQRRQRRARLDPHGSIS